jgi:hypothetical protein
MKATVLPLVLAAVTYSPISVADTTCPVTTIGDPLFGTSIPGWYGTESFAVQLPSPAILPITQPGYAIGGRLFWRSSGFRPGTESELQIQLRNLNGAPATGRISRATNAYVPSQQPGRPFTAAESEQIMNEAFLSSDAWRMLTGIDFKDAGCWEITASYLGQTLTFVVETVDPDRKSANILSPIGGFNPEAIVNPKRNTAAK